MPDSLKNIMANKFQKSPMAKQITASLIIEFANKKISELWGKKGAEMARAVSLKKQILKIICQNAIIAQEISFKKNTIIEAVNQKFTQGTVKKINIVQKRH